VVQECFSPSPETIELARGICAAHDEAEAAGKGAFSYRGKMIDMPTVLQMRQVLHVAKSVNLI
jgi:citrate lyase beta subunit